MLLLPLPELVLEGRFRGGQSVRVARRCSQLLQRRRFRLKQLIILTAAAAATAGAIIYCRCWLRCG